MAKRGSGTVAVSSVQQHQDQMEKQLLDLEKVISTLTGAVNAYRDNAEEWNTRAERLSGIERGELDGARFNFDEHTLETLRVFREMANTKAQEDADSERRLTDMIDKATASRNELSSALTRVRTYNAVTSAVSALSPAVSSGVKTDIEQFDEVLNQSRRTVHEANALMEIGAGRDQSNMFSQLGM